MGGGYYDGDVGRRQRQSTTREHFTFRGHQADPKSERRECHPLLNIKGQKRECCTSAEHPVITPIVVAMDVTRSRGDDAKVIFGKLPMMIGQINMKNYAPHPEVSFAAIGDASCGDQAPIQVGQFESDNRLDEVLKAIWLEEGGGGTGQESYELMAYYYAYHAVIDGLKNGRKGVFFFLGDEGFYPAVKADQIRTFIGDNVKKDIPSGKVFADLQKKFEVFFIFPSQTWEERKADIDAEIKKRVEKAGGQYKNVDVRASLIWNNRNDLDLHAICPSGEEIFYAQKESGCGGWLDVDMNVHGETTKPVENVRWKKNTAPRGEYSIFVRNYRFHETPKEPTPFRVEIEINGKIQHFEGVCPAYKTGEESDQHIITFNYNPEERQQVNKEKAYEMYDDGVITTQWGSVIPPENILKIDDPKAIVDIMLGVLAIREGDLDLEKYLQDMADRDQTQTRIEQVRGSLVNLAQSSGLSKVAIGNVSRKGQGRKRKTATKRL